MQVCTLVKCALQLCRLVHTTLIDLTVINVEGNMNQERKCYFDSYFVIKSMLDYVDLEDTELFKSFEVLWQILCFVCVMICTPWIVWMYDLDGRMPHITNTLFSLFALFAGNAS